MAKIQLGKHGMPQQKGNFQLVGLVTGVKKPEFFEAKMQRNNVLRNTAKFGVKTSLSNEVYPQISDSEKENVYFYRQKDEKAGISALTKKVPWDDRFNFDEDGFNLIGTVIGVEKELDEKGKEKNKSVLKTAFDGAKYLEELSMEGKFKDGMAVRVMGDLEFSSFDGKDGKIRAKKLIINKLYGSYTDIEADDFVEISNFKQPFIFMEVEQIKVEGKTRYAIRGKIATYSGFEDVEFLTDNAKIANNMKKKLKPYNSISVFGEIVNKAIVEEVENDDDWGGEADPFEKVNSKRSLELVVTGVDGKTLDKETYTEEKINNFLKADSDFGAIEDEDDDWGSDDGELDEDF